MRSGEFSGAFGGALGRTSINEYGKQRVTARKSFGMERPQLCNINLVLKNYTCNVYILVPRFQAASGRCPDVTETCCSHVGPHLVIPGYIINTAEPSDFKFHPIKKDVPYRLWNPVSNGLIQRDPSNPSIVTCSGAFGSDSANSENIFTHLP